MAIIGYGDDVNLLTPSSSADPDALDAALNAAKTHTANKANLFTALNTAIEKFLPYRSRGYELVFIIAGTSPGDDLQLADPAIIALKRAVVPVYGFGPTIPFGTCAWSK